MLKKLFYKMKKSKKNVIFLGIGCLILVGLILIPFSFAELTPVKSVNIYSKNSSYDDNTPGAWKIEKSGKWVSKGTAEVTFKVDTISMMKSKGADIYLVLDTSGSMEGSKLDRVKFDSLSLINDLFSSSDGNKVGLIRFSNDSEVLTDLTNNKELLTNDITNLVADGETNYYGAFVNVGNLIKNYQKQSNRDCVILFLTDGLPNINTPNEVAQYNYLKSEYPWLIINGIQYEMGETILEPIKKVTDNQFVAKEETLNKALEEASVEKVKYENFTITDYIDTRYFSVESTNDITVNSGTVALDKENQKVIWNLTELRSGLKLNQPEMKIKVKLKEELVGAGGVYPTNSHEVINTKIENQVESVDSNLTPILADNYKITYDANEPVGCNVTSVPKDEFHSVFDIVDISEEKPVCEGYKFKGWKLTGNVEKIGDDKFIMPEANVQLKGTWSKINLKKSMDGKIYEIQSLYEMMRDNSRDSDKSLSFSSKNIDATSGIYQHYETSSEDYPVYYYRGDVNNNNLKFANICWKIVRTTETGGVKLIYSGLPASDGSCNNTGKDLSIGSSAFNIEDPLLSNVGYKHGDSQYPINNCQPWFYFAGKWQDYDYNMSNTNYYYSDSVTYQNGKYTLNNAKQYYWSDNYSKLGHYYTCKLDTNGGCESGYFVLSGDNMDGFLSYNAPTMTTMNSIIMENGETYESLYAKAEQVNWVFGDDANYDSSSDSYTLTDPVEVNALDYLYNNASEKIENSHHYTCFNSSNVCKNNYSSYVYYVFYFSDDKFPWAMQLEKGKKIDDILNEAIIQSPNENKSTILNTIDEWYAANLKATEYEKYIEDTVWCNDRSISSFGGWKKDGSNKEYLYFGAYGRNRVSPYRPSLICPNEIDRFSTTNEKAKLDYPVGLLTADEVALAGSGYRSYSEKSYLYTGGNQWLLSPDAYRGRVTDDLIYRDGGFSSVFIINSFGILEDYHMQYSWLDLNTVEHNYEVRPSISLKPGVIIASGDGSNSNPYTLLDDFKPLTLYNVSIESNQVKKTFIKAEKGRRVLIESNIEGKVVVSFKLDGKEVKGNNFIMPNKNVVITDVVLDDIKSVVYESSHNPYEGNLNKIYEQTFNDATSLTVELEYETEGILWDYVSLYGSNDAEYGKYGGKTRSTETITISGDYIKIVFHTDNSNGDYYGFKATVTPNYD